MTSGSNTTLASKEDEPLYGAFFGVMGTTAAMVLTALGGAYGTAKAGSGIAGMAVARPNLIMKAIIPVIMAGIIAIYGLVVAVVLTTTINDSHLSLEVADVNKYTALMGFLHLGAGLSVGFCGLAAGFAIGMVGDVGARGTAKQPRLFVGMVLILIFSEVLGLYGLIVALIIQGKGTA